MKSLSDIVDDIHKNGATGLTKDQITTTAKAVITSITGALKSDGEVRIDKFGTFKKTFVPAHDARNPATGGTSRVPDKNKTKFKASTTLEAALQ